MSKRSDAMPVVMSRRERRRLAKEQARQSGTHWTQQWRKDHKPPPVMQPLEITKITPEEAKTLKQEQAEEMVEDREAAIEKAVLTPVDYRGGDKRTEENGGLPEGWRAWPLKDLRSLAQSFHVRVDGKRPSLCTKTELIAALDAL